MKIYLYIVATLIVAFSGGTFFIEFEARSARVAAKVESEHQAKIEQEQNDIKTGYKTSKLLSRINDLENRGLVSREQAQKMRDELLGKTQLYVAPDGTITTNSECVILVPNSSNPPTASQH